MKKISYFVFVLCLFFGFRLEVFAGSLSVWASANTITVGDSVSISVASKNIFCKYDIKLSDGSILSGPGSGNVDDGETSVYTFVSKAAGSVTVTIVPTDGADYDTNGEYTQSKSVTIKVVNKESSNSNNSGGSSSSGGSQSQRGGTTADKKEYDSNNDLESLSVDGYELNPSFTKDNLEYKLEVDETVEKINVKASASSDKAQVRGIGEINLTQGDNSINVTVEAENGNEKVYKILVNVKDLHPIKVTVDGKEYTLVKKNNDIIEKLEYCNEEIIKIDDTDVISYINPVTKVRLVILKDSKNKVGYYIYNEQSKKYSKYKAVTIGSITLQLLDINRKLKYFKKYQVKVNGEEVDLYKVKKSNKMGIIYGTNVKNGNTGYYVYDSENDSVSKYYDEEVNAVKKELLDYKSTTMIVIGILSGITIVTIFISIVKAIKGRKKPINHTRKANFM